MRRYTVLGTNGARLISTDLIEVAVLAMYKYARPTMKWADMVNSAKDDETRDTAAVRFEIRRLPDHRQSPTDSTRRI